MFTNEEKTTEINTSNILVDAGLAFEVEKKPHYCKSFTRQGEVFTESAMSCGIFRTDTGAEIGDVSKTYEIAQYSDIVAPWITAANEGYLQYKSGCAIEGGRRFTLTFETGQSKIQGEDLRRRIIVSGSHDGSWAVNFKTFIWRQICKNGLMGFGLQDSFRCRHTTNWKEKYQSVLQLLADANRFYDSALERYRQLFNIPLNIQGARALTMKLLDIKGELKDESTRKQNQVTDILSLTYRGKGIAGNNEILNTGAAWVNAVAEYYDHYQNRKDEEKQYLSAYFGSGEERKKKAVELALQLA